MKIAITGCGYVGLSNGLLLSQNHEVVALDLDAEKVNNLNFGISAINDEEVNFFLNRSDINFRATLDKKDAYYGADYVIISTPTNYDETTNFFNTDSVESAIIDVIEINPKACIVIKSTIPVGFTEKIKKKLNITNIFFSPEFLREGKALFDNLNPSRIVIGDVSDSAKKFSAIMVEGAVKNNIDVLLTNSTEAEAIKLFSNTYLAMRISFFNELDSFAEFHALDSKKIIQGVCMDLRIGSHYNNPSFGYGGYCLPKDTRQLKENFHNIPNSLINSIVEANSVRKDNITNSIIAFEPKTVGIHRLIMKSNSDNYRSSSILGIIKRLRNEDIKIIVYEPTIKRNNEEGFEIISDLEEFKKLSNLIVTNRYSSDLHDVMHKVYTRDVFNRD